MSKNQKTRRTGSTLLEFTLVGIPLIFVVISTVEMARGMWLYSTLAAAVKDGARYAVVHGQNCVLPPNTCSVTISNIARVIQRAGAGLPADYVTLTFTPATGTATTCTLNACLANYTTAAWPPSAASAPGMRLKISGAYRFQSAISVFWPGAGSARGSPGVVNFSADSLESIQF